MNRTKKDNTNIVKRKSDVGERCGNKMESKMDTRLRTILGMIPSSRGSPERVMGMLLGQEFRSTGGRRA